jgi:hypothetical protein
MTLDDLETLATELMEQGVVARMRSADAQACFRRHGPGLTHPLAEVYAAAQEMVRAAGELRNVARDAAAVQSYRAVVPPLTAAGVARPDLPEAEPW